MSPTTIENIRTIALVGHTASGKTTLTEALLVEAGVIGSAGTVERGTTVTDSEPMEKLFKQSLNSGVVHMEHQGKRIHLIDTPGSPDFVGPSISALTAVETAAIVVHAQRGMELVTKRMFNWTAQRKVCRMIIINAIDAAEADLPALVEELQSTVGKECLPINLPADKGQKVIDCYTQSSGSADFSSVDKAHSALVDQVVEVDESLMEVYLEQGEVTPEQLHAPLVKALREGHLIPICFVSARTGVGVPELLNIIATLMPNPKEGNAPLLMRKTGEAEEPFLAESDSAKRAIGHIFRLTIDPFVGKLGVFRIFQGRVAKDSMLYVGHARKPFKVAHLFMLKGKETVEIDAALPGDIVAVAKVDDLEWFGLIHEAAEDENISMKPLELPKPIFSLAITAKKRGDEQKVRESLNKLAVEDPCLKVEQSASTNELILHGLSDQHLRAAMQKMTEIYKVETESHPPRIAYRETVGANAEGHHRHKKQTGGAGQFGEVFLRIEPLPRGTGFEFVDKVVGGTIPGQFLPAIEKGVRSVLEAGPLAGNPMQDVRVIVYDGKHHPVDSKEIAFQTAGKKAFMDAISKASPIILEPIVNVQITVPEFAIGDVTGDLSSRRGQVLGTEPGRGSSTIAGRVPLAEFNDYASRLKSVSAGQGSFTMELSHYEPLPPNIQQQLVAAAKAAQGAPKDDD